MQHEPVAPVASGGAAPQGLDVATMSAVLLAIGIACVALNAGVFSTEATFRNQLISAVGVLAGAAITAAALYHMVQR